MRLRDLGAVVPPATRPRIRVRFILAARLLGTGAVSELVLPSRGTRRRPTTASRRSTEIEAIAADEREHAAIWKRLGDEPSTTGRRRGPSGRTMQATAVVAAAASPDRARRGREPGGDHARGGLAPSARSGTLRAIIFGVSDGPVSNLALVMGVAGASDDGRLILFTGIAACSPARSRWRPASTSRCRASGSCSSARSRSSGRSSRRCRGGAAGARRPVHGQGVPAREAERVAARSSRTRSTRSTPSSARSWARPGRARLAGRRVRLVPRVRDRRRDPGPALPVRGTAVFVASLVLSLASLFVVGAGVSLLTAEHAVQRPAARDRRRGRGGDAVGTLIGVARTGQGIAAMVTARTSRRGCAPRAWMPAPGPTGRTTATPPTTTATTRCSVCVAGPIRFGLPATARAPSCARATAWSCRPAPRTTRRSGPDGDLPRGAPAGGPHPRAPAVRRRRP